MHEVDVIVVRSYPCLVVQSSIRNHIIVVVIILIIIMVIITAIMQSVLSVSYTHLTLPTKLEV